MRKCRDVVITGATQEANKNITEELKTQNEAKSLSGAIAYPLTSVDRYGFLVSDKYDLRNMVIETS